MMMAVAFAACNNQTKQPAEDQKNEVITVDVFFDKAEAMVGKTITVKGMVDHVCKHGGKRMFIIGEKPENRLKLTTGEGIASFDVEMEGGNAMATGVVEMMKIDTEYLDNWEKEIRAEAEKKSDEGVEEEHDHQGHNHDGDDHAHDHTSHGEKADMGEHIPGLDKIEAYRTELEESGKEYLTFFSVVTTKIDKAE